MIHVSNKTIIKLCFIGVLIGFAFNARFDEFLLWHATQYIAVALLIAPLFKSYCVIFAGVCAMLIIDGWLLIEVILGFNTKLTMLFALITSLKVITVFPFGCAIGFILNRNRKFCINDKTT